MFGLRLQQLGNNLYIAGIFYANNILQTSLSYYCIILLPWCLLPILRDMSSIKVDDISSKIAKNVGSAVEVTNKLPGTSRNVEFRYNRKNPKRRRFLEASPEKFTLCFSLDNSCGPNSAATSNPLDTVAHQERGKTISGETIVSVDIDERLASLSSMVAVLCEQQLFLPLLRAFEMFLPSCSLLSFIRSLQVSSNSLFSLQVAFN